MLHAITAVFLIQVNDGFGLAARAVLVPLCLQIGSQFRMVIDFPVVDDPDIAVLVSQRLVTAFYVNNAEASHGQPNVLFDEEPFIVWTAMHDLPVHACQHIARNAPVTVLKEDSADSTHSRFISLEDRGRRVGRLYSR